MLGYRQKDVTFYVGAHRIDIELTAPGEWEGDRVEGTTTYGLFTLWEPGYFVMVAIVFSEALKIVQDSAADEARMSLSFESWWPMQASHRQL